MGLTQELGSFVSGVRFDDLPAAGVAVAKLGFIDCAGVMIAGSVEPVVRIVMQTVLEGCEKPEAALFFSERRVPAPLAAWVNGCAAHALDYDDAGGHRSAILVPALLAEGEALGASGCDMIAAYVTGFEVWSELARRERGHLHERGWHPTGIYGALASAAAAARLHNLNPERTTTALAIAASNACGVVANFGSMVKPFHAGNSARAGILAARLAENGMSASAQALEHERGLLAAVSQHGEVDRARPASTLGIEWRIGEEGVSIKKFPTCYCTHRAIDAMLELAAAHSIEPGQVRDIVVSIGRTQKAILHSDMPTTALEAKFSIQFAMACALIEHKVTLSELVDATVRRPDVQAMMKRVRVELIDEYDTAMPQYAPYDQVRVRLKSGRVFESARIERARGHIMRPLTEQELYTKFASCLEFAGSGFDAQGLFTMLNHLDRQPAGWLGGVIARQGKVATQAATAAAN